MDVTVDDRDQSDPGGEDAEEAEPMAVEDPVPVFEHFMFRAASEGD